jgi:ribosome-associated protein
MMNSKELALSIARFLDSKKATDLEVIQIGELTTIGDYFVVATAGNTTLVKSLCEDLDEYLGRQGIEPKRIEGRSSAQWILMDYRDVIVHIFYSETRDFYSIDRVWADAPRLPLDLQGEGE